MARTKVRGSQQLNATFLDLTDTPVEYGTSAGFITVVNNAGDALEFKDKNELLPPVEYYNDIITSDGSTRVHSLTTAPEVESVIVTLEGMALSYGAANDYTISGSTLTLNASVPLESGMKIDVTYVALDTTATTGQTFINANPADLNVQGNTTVLTVDENSVGFGAALHIDTDGNLVMADADGTSVIPCHFLAAETGTGAKIVLLQGFARDDTWSWTPGEPLYVATTAGELTQTAPSTEGDRVQIVGYAVSATVIYFNPDFTDLTIG